MTTMYVPQPSSLAAEVILWFAKRAPDTELSIPQALREFDRVKNTAQVAPCLNSPVSHGVLNRARNEQAQLVYRRGRHFDGCLALMRPRMITLATADQRAAAPTDATVLTTGAAAAAAYSTATPSTPAPTEQSAGASGGLEAHLQQVDRAIQEARQQDQQATSEAQIASGSQWFTRKLEEARSADQAAPALADQTWRSSDTSTGTVTRPALRYHGGKFRLAPWILQFFPPHQAYAEVFAGAGSLLLLKQPSPAEVYNDLDGRVVGFFRVLQDRDKALELQRRCSLTPYARASLEWSFGEPDDEVDAAHRLVVRSFMGHGSDSATRTTRTGFRSRLTDGRALPSAEWSTWSDIIPALRDRLRRVLIENDRAERVIDRMDAPETLFYCDPPYLHSTRTGKTGGSGSNGYMHEMSDEDHEALLLRLQHVQGMVVLSGYPSDLYEDTLGSWERFERRHVADTAKFRTEVVWLNPACSAALERARGGLFAELA